MKPNIEGSLGRLLQYRSMGVSGNLGTCNVGKAYLKPKDLQYRIGQRLDGHTSASSIKTRGIIAPPLLAGQRELSATRTEFHAEVLEQRGLPARFVFS